MRGVIHSRLKLGISAFAVMYVSACMVMPNYQQSDQLRGVTFKNGVTIRPPKDYCLDKKLMAETEEAGFSLILPCLDAVGDVEAGLVTVTVVSNNPEAELYDKLKSTKQNKQNLHSDQRFGVVQHGSAEKIVGMQDDGWQLVKADKRYTSVLTLYVPQYVTITEKAALSRLRSVLNSIQHQQNAIIPGESENDTVIRPRARPLT